MEGVLLKDLTRRASDSYRAKVVVRLARKWEFRSRQTGELYELDFVLVDREGNQMEGAVPAKRFDRFNDVLKEGSVYSIQYFNIWDARKNYRAVDNPNRICLTQRTQLKEIPPPVNFPFFAYNAMQFDVLSATRMNNNTVLSDVVGMVIAVTDTAATSANQQPRRHVIIGDGSERAVVTLWDEHADAFDAAGLATSSIQEPIVVLFVGVTVGIFNGMLALQSTSATKWYVNIPIPEIAAVKERFHGRPHQIEWQSGANPRVEPVDSTIVAIAQELPNDVMGKRFRLKVLVTALVSTNDWWYLACKGCWKKTQPYGDAYRCSRCSITKGGPRYKITVNGVDLDSNVADNPEIARFTFFGQAGEAITGREELALVGSCRGIANYIPPEIANIVGRKYTLVVEPSSESLDEDFFCFYVNSSELINDHLIRQPAKVDAQPSGSENVLTVHESEIIQPANPVAPNAPASLPQTNAAPMHTTDMTLLAAPTSEDDTNLDTTVDKAAEQSTPTKDILDVLPSTPVDENKNSKKKKGKHCI